MNNPYSDVPKALPDLDLVALAQGREIELDIGFGRGQFILSRAAEYPDKLLLGLEMRRKWVGLVGQRAQRLELANVEVYFGDSRHLLPAWGPDGVLSAVFVHFPDPWWKKKHQKRRVLTAETVHHFARLLRPGGVVFAQTDVEERAGSYRDALSAEPSLREKLGSAAEPLDHNPVGTRSHREKKCEAADLPVYRFLFEKIVPDL